MLKYYFLPEQSQIYRLPQEEQTQVFIGTATRTHWEKIAILPEIQVVTPKHWGITRVGPLQRETARV